MPRALRRMACAVFAVLALPGCEISPPPPPLTIGISPSPGFEYLYYAQESGIFDRAGLAVRLVEYDSRTDARVAFERGQLDGVAGTLVDLQEARLRAGLVSRAVLVLQSFADGDRLLVRHDVAGIVDLVGRRVAVEPASLHESSLERVLRNGGVRLDQLQLVRMSHAGMYPALLAGQVDAMLTRPLPVAALQRHDDVRALFEPGDGRAEFVDVLAFERTVLARRVEEIRLLVSLWDTIADEVRRYGDEALALMAEREQLTLEEFKQAMTGVRRATLAEQPEYFAGGRLSAVSAALAPAVAQRHDLDPAQLAGCCHDDAWRPPASGPDLATAPGST